LGSEDGLVEVLPVRRFDLGSGLGRGPSAVLIRERGAVASDDDLPHAGEGAAIIPHLALDGKRAGFRTGGNALAVPGARSTVATLHQRASHVGK
jgi:hypothetical protein